MPLQQEIIVILTGAAPISEVRGAIPLGVLLFDFHPLKAYLLAVLGNLLPVIPLLFFLNFFTSFLMRRFYFFNRLFSWLFDRVRERHADHFHYWKWTPLALFIFVAIPLPFTGAWSGTVAAIVFGIPLWRSAAAISLGVLTAGAIVLALTSFGIYTFNSI